MDSEKIKRMLDACYMAKRIRELLPKLPDGVSPAYIQYLDVIHTLQKTKEYVKVSDISDALNLPRPGVTRTVKAMEEKGYLKKMGELRILRLQKVEKNCLISTTETITADWLRIWT